MLAIAKKNPASASRFDLIARNDSAIKNATTTATFPFRTGRTLWYQINVNNNNTIKIHADGFQLLNEMPINTIKSTKISKVVIQIEVATIRLLINAYGA